MGPGVRHHMTSKHNNTCALDARAWVGGSTQVSHWAQGSAKMLRSRNTHLIQTRALEGLRQVHYPRDKQLVITIEHKHWDTE